VNASAQSWTRYAQAVFKVLAASEAGSVA